jgi:probable metal-binding protein
MVCVHMTNEVHIHEIMKLMISSGKTYTRATLKAELLQAFGAGTTFCTCSMQGIDADQAIEFMEMRGKFVPSKDGFSMPAEHMCNH